MTIQLKQSIQDAFAAVGGDDADNAMFVAFFQERHASAEARVAGIDNTIASLTAQREAAQAEVDRLAATIARYTEDVLDEEPEEEPEEEPGA